MIDGPHRTLPLPKHWKKVAQRAENQNYSPEEIASALQDALRIDCQQIGLEKIVEQLRYPTLFRQNTLANIEFALKSSRDSSISCSLWAYMAYNISQDMPLMMAFRNALHLSIDKRIDERFQAIEEHYLASGQPECKQIRQTLSEAEKQLKIPELVSTLIDPDPRATVGEPKPPKRRTGLDEGPALPRATVSQIILQCAIR